MDTTRISKKHIGERLRNLRLQFKLTTEDVAALINTSPTRYVQLESGEITTNEGEELLLDELIILCNHYGISFNEFTGTHDEICLNELSIDLNELSTEQTKTITEILCEMEHL